MRNYAIDWIRALSMLFIVGYWHLFNYTRAFPGYYNPASFMLAMLALGLFVLVSGYLVGRKELALDREQVARFLQSRAKRIYPPFVLALIAFDLFGLSSKTILFKSGFLLSMLWGPAPTTLWFVVMICMFYLFVPFLIAYSEKIVHYCFLVIGVYAGLGLLSQIFQTFDTRTLVYFPVFAVGLFMGKNEKNMAIPLWTLAVLFLPSFAISRHALFSFSGKSIALTPIILIASVCLFLVAVKLLSGRKAPLLIMQLSYASYFMYLFHRPVFQLTHRVWFPTLGSLQIAYLLVVCLPIVIIFSWIAQCAYDQTLKQLTQRCT